MIRARQSRFESSGNCPTRFHRYKSFFFFVAAAKLFVFGKY
jgi:hypothetical protein